MDNERFRRCTIAALIMLSGAALAQAQEAPDASEIGDSACALIALQSGGKVAAPARPMLGDEAGATYARYLKSFNTTIPEHFGLSVGDVGSGSSACTVSRWRWRRRRAWSAASGT